MHCNSNFPLLSQVVKEKENIEDLLEIIKFYSKKQDCDAWKSMEYGEDNVRRNLKEYDVIQVLLSSPQIQISLGNPKMFTGTSWNVNFESILIFFPLAYMSILESSSNLSLWINDSDFSPLLQHIMRLMFQQQRDSASTTI